MKKILSMWIGVVAVVVLGSSFLTSCSEGLDSISSTNFITNAFQWVESNRLLLIDEKNEVLLSVNPTSGGVEKTLGVVGDAANDIELEGDYAYIAVSLDNKVLRINLTNGDWKMLSFSGANPYQLCLNGNRLFVSQSVSNQVSVIDTADFSLITNVNLPSPGAPQKIVADGTYLYVTSSDGYIGWGNPTNYTNSRVVVMDQSTYQVVTNIPVSLNPVGLAVYSNRLFVACAGNYDNTAGVDVIDLSNNYAVSHLGDYTNKIATAVEVNGNKLYTLFSAPWPNPGYLAVYDLSSDTSVTNLLSASLKGIAFHGNKAYVSEGYGGTNTYAIDTTSWGVITFSPTGGGDLIFY